MRKFEDERGYIITESELMEEFTELKANGETDAETFAQYIRNCTSKNGTLTEINI